MTKPPLISESEKRERKREKEIAVLRLLRQNARAKKASIAKQIGMPAASTANLFRKTAKKYVTRYSSLIDFEKMGYFVGSFFVIKLPKEEENKDLLIKYLKKSKNINTMSRTTADELLVETHFRNMADFIDFRHFIEETAEYVKEHEIVCEVEKEKFLT